MSEKGDGISKQDTSPESVGVNLSKSTTPLSPKNQPNNSKGGLSLIGLAIVLFLVIFVPTEGSLYICMLPLMMLLVLKDFLNIPTKIFVIILICLGVIWGIQFINAMVGLGMY